MRPRLSDRRAQSIAKFFSEHGLKSLPIYVRGLDTVVILDALANPAEQTMTIGRLPIMSAAERDQGVGRKLGTIAPVERYFTRQCPEVDGVTRAEILDRK